MNLQSRRKRLQSIMDKVFDQIMLVYNEPSMSKRHAQLVKRYETLLSQEERIMDKIGIKSRNVCHIRFCAHGCHECTGYHKNGKMVPDGHGSLCEMKYPSAEKDEILFQIGELLNKTCP